MVGIPKDLQEKIENGETSGYTVLEEGHYLAQIVEAEEVPARNDKSYPYIKTVWRVLEPEEFEDEKLFLNLSFSPKAAWKLTEVFDALGYSYDSDFEEMIEAEEEAVLYVIQELIDRGKRKGQVGSTVDSVLEPTEENRALVD